MSRKDQGFWVIASARVHLHASSWKAWGFSGIAHARVHLLEVLLPAPTLWAVPHRPGSLRPRHRNALAVW